MTHRAETIMTNVLSTITGLTTTSTRVERSQVRTVEVMPALSLDMGRDDVNPESSNFPELHRDLNVKITIYVKNNSNPDAQLNLIREEVFNALMANRLLGLDYVVDMSTIGDDEPEISGDADQLLRKQQMNFVIEYRHAWDDAGA